MNIVLLLLLEQPCPRYLPGSNVMWKYLWYGNNYTKLRHFLSSYRLKSYFRFIFLRRLFSSYIIWWNATVFTYVNLCELRSVDFALFIPVLWIWNKTESIRIETDEQWMQVHLLPSNLSHSTDTILIENFPVTTILAQTFNSIWFQLASNDICWPFLDDVVCA